MRRAPRLADTLAQLAHAGLADFYRGDVAREIAADLERIGAPVTRADLKKYQAAWREPLVLRRADATLYNTPAPTQGLASLILLGLYERLDVRGLDGFAHAHALIECAKRAMAIRDEACVDYAHATHDFAALLSAQNLDREAARIDKARAAPWPLPQERGDTVWMGAIDGEGLAVSYIQSVYWQFGSGCVLARTGVAMQNRGLAFSLDENARNPLTPGRRPFHTLNPPLAVFDDGRVLSYGSMGGDGQPQFQAQVFTRIAAGQSLAQALSAPRHLSAAPGARQGRASSSNRAMTARSPPRSPRPATTSNGAAKRSAIRSGTPGRCCAIPRGASPPRTIRARTAARRACENCGWSALDDGIATHCAPQRY